MLRFVRQSLREHVALVIVTVVTMHLTVPVAHSEQRDDWANIEQELLGLSPLLGQVDHTMQNIAAEFVNASPRLHALDLESTNVLVQMVNQHARDMEWVPIVGVAILADTDTDTFYKCALQLAIEWRTSDPSSLAYYFSELLIKALAPLNGTERLAGMVLEYLSHRYTEAIAWSLDSILFRLEIGEALYQEFLRPEGFKTIPLDYLAQIVIWLQAWEDDADIGRSAKLEGLIETLNRFSGVPRYVFASIYEGDPAIVNEAIARSIEYIDAHWSTIPDPEDQVTSLLLVRHLIVDHDVMHFDVSPRMKDVVTEWISTWRSSEPD